MVYGALREISQSWPGLLYFLEPRVHSTSALIMKSLLAFCVLAAAASSVTANPFTNLDFESANTNSVRINSPGAPFVNGQGNVTDLVPGWNLTTVGFSYDFINFNQ